METARKWFNTVLLLVIALGVIGLGNKASHIAAEVYILTHH